MAMKQSEDPLVIITFVCSFLSAIGSLLVLGSYAIASTKSRPKAAQLIRNLAFADLLWMICAFIESAYWISPGSSEPDALCYITSPFINFFRMASLMWTCAISFDVLMSLQRRKWLYDGEEKGWQMYRNTYYTVITVVSLPGAVINSVIQIGWNAEGDHNSSFGCKSGHETGPDNLTLTLTFLEVIPILLGFLFNIYIFFTVSHIMGKKSYPQSVRKRRRNIMYHYIIVCIVSWLPTIIVYLITIYEVISGELLDQKFLMTLVYIARSCSYLVGFFNFIVFGMQDPHLKRSFDLILHSIAVFCGISTVDENLNAFDLKSHDVVKNVMFEESTINKNADISKDKRHIYRKNRLSREDKENLYRERPDLEPVASPLPPQKGGNNANGGRPSSPKTAMKVPGSGSSPRSGSAIQGGSSKDKVLATSPRSNEHKSIGFSGNNDSTNSSINSSNTNSGSDTSSNVGGNIRISSTNSSSTHRDKIGSNVSGGGDDVGGNSLAVVINSAISYVVQASNNNDGSNTEDGNDENDINEPLLQSDRFGRKANIDGKYIKKEAKTLSLTIPPAEEYESDGFENDLNHDVESNSSAASGSVNSGRSSDSSSEDEKDDEDHELAQMKSPRSRFSPRNSGASGF